MSGATWKLKGEVEDFLFHEASLLDEHRYDSWLAIWTQPARYWAPARDEVQEGPEIPEGAHALAHFEDDYVGLAIRVKRLMGRHVHANSPLARLRRIVSNIRILDQDADNMGITSNFLCFKSRLGKESLLVGRRDDRLVRTDDGLRLRERRILFDHGTVPSLGVLY